MGYENKVEHFQITTATKPEGERKKCGLTYSCIIWRRVEILNLRVKYIY